MPAKSVSEVIKTLAKHPEGLLGLFHRMGYVVLLPLLELPRKEVAENLKSSFRECGLNDADCAGISLRDLIVFALTSKSDHWTGLAARWIAEGFPVDEAVIGAADEMIKTKQGTQSDRQMLIRLIRKHS